MATKRGEKSRFEMSGLRKKEPEYIEKVVLPNDTLQGVALLYNTTVSELKKINHIFKDSELHARRTIKVPSRCILVNLGDEPPESAPLLIPDLNENEEEDPVLVNGKLYFEDKDAQIEEIRRKAEAVAANSVIDGTITPPLLRKDDSSTDIKWWKIFVPCFVSILILPILIYYFLRHIPHDPTFIGIDQNHSLIHEH